MPIARWARSGLVAAAALAFTGQAAWGAGELGWYYGISGGQSHADLGQADLDELANFVISSAGQPLTSSSTINESDTAWSIFFGYQFSQYLAFEGGYLDLGKFPYRYTGTVDLGVPTGVAPSSLDFDFKTSGYPVSIVGMLPVGPRFDVHARAGVLFANSAVKIFATAGSDSIAPSFKASSMDFYYGAGASMNLGDSWAISVDWLKYNGVGDGDVIVETDLDSLSLSLIYRIGPL